MPNRSSLPSSRFSKLPGWEHILKRLHVVETENPSGDFWPEIIRVLTDNENSIEEAIGQLCAMLRQKLKPAKIVFARPEQGKGVVVASTISSTQANQLINRQPMAQFWQTNKPGSRTFKMTIDQREIFTFALPIGIFDTPYPSVMMVVTNQPLDRAERPLVHTIANMLNLRLAKEGLSERLNREGQRIETLMFHLSEGMMVLDNHLRVTLWNRPLQRLTGYSPKEAIGQHYQRVIRRLDQPDWLQEIIEQSASGHKTAFFADFEFLTKAKVRKWVSVSGSFLHNAQGQVEQTIIITRDISHVKQLENRKSEFISIATHELRTPITAIKGYLSLLARDQKNLTEKQITYLDRASQANDRLVRLAEDLLRTVQIEEDRLQFNFQPVDLGRTLRKIVTDFRPKARSKQLIIEVQRVSEKLLITADAERIEQVFANLIDNALKYTLKGKIAISFKRIENSMKAEDIIVEIKDSGIGIAHRQLSEIFEKFHRSDKAQQVKETGAGLGLFIVKSFVEKQSGKISVKSKLGRGTTFEVRFPALETKERHAKG